MKLSRIILLFILITVGLKVNAQKIQGAFALGTNLSQIDGDEVYGFKKLGLNSSAIAIIPFKEKWAVSLEASFSQKGALQIYPYEYDPDKETPYYKNTLTYAEVPILIHFTDKEFMTIGAGASWGRLVEINEVEWGVKTDAGIFSGHYKRYDINAIIDIRFPIKERLKFNFRYAYSIGKIRTRTYINDIGDTWSRNQYNNVLSFRLYYIFNEKR